MEGSGAPLGEVQIFLTGTGVGSLTRQNGRYVLLNVPPGSYEMRAERIGLGSSTAQITVAAGETVVQDFTLTEEALGLDEIVVTGTAGAARQREIGNTIAQINAAEIPDRPVLVSDILQSQAPGLEVYGGGGVGQAKIIRLRGQSSVSLSNHPLIYIDGVRMRSDPLPDANPPDRRGGRSGNIAVSPLDNINPNDIERIEVIKGSAATTLYGTEASAGVIQVFTKRGRRRSPRVDGRGKGRKRLEPQVRREGFRRRPLHQHGTLALHRAVQLRPVPSGLALHAGLLALRQGRQAGSAVLHLGRLPG